MVTWERTRDDVGSHGVGDGIVSLVGGVWYMMLGMLWLSDPLVTLHGSLCIYSTSASLTIAYNLGAIGGILYGMQVGSGLCVAMSYVASEEYSFPTLDASPHYTWSNSTHASLYVPTLYLSHPMSHATYPLCVSILRHAV